MGGGVCVRSCGITERKEEHSRTEGHERKKKTEKPLSHRRWPSDHQEVSTTEIHEETGAGSGRSASDA